MGKLTQQDKKSKNKLLAVFKEVYQIWVSERPATFAAAMAYYALFSVVPLIYIILFFANLVLEKLSIGNQLYTLASDFFGEEVVIYFQERIANLAETTTGGTILGSAIGIITILFSASFIFFQIQHTLNFIFHVPPPPRDATREMIRNRILAFAMLLGIVLIVILALAINLSISFVASYIQLNFLISLLSFSFLAGLGTLTIALMFKILSNADIAWKHIWPGAAAVAVIVSLLFQLIGIFLSSTRFTSALEAAGAVSILLITYYFLGQIFVLGAVLTRVLAAKGGKTITPRH